MRVGRLVEILNKHQTVSAFTSNLSFLYISTTRVEVTPSDLVTNVLIKSWSFKKAGDLYSIK